MIQKGILSERIIPIIEPIAITSTFISTLNEFVENERKIGLIMNPKVGDLCSNNIITNESEKLKKLLPSKYILKSLLVGGDNISEQCEYDIAILKENDDLKKYVRLKEKNKFKYNLIPDNSSYRRKIKDYTVLHEDYFNKAEKNADYLMKEDEFYSDDCFFYKKENFEGFGDYSIVGDDFFTSGFAPRAIAIHIIYYVDEELRIHHFVSASNDDINNPAGKYGEAVEKLAKWVESNNDKIEMTSGLTFFINSYNRESYHGLGIIKKYSIMHHLELISKIFEKED